MNVSTQYRSAITGRQRRQNLRGYVTLRRDLWHTVIHEHAISAAWVDDALAALQVSSPATAPWLLEAFTLSPLRV